MGEDDTIGCVPNNTHILVYVIYKGADGCHMIYAPPNLKYWDKVDKKYRTDKGCGCVWFARLDYDRGVLVRDEDYINFNSVKENEKFLRKFTKCKLI